MKHARMAWLAGIALSLLVAGQAFARDFKVEPGQVPELRPGEGLLVVGVDSDAEVKSLLFRRVDSLWTGGSLRDIGVGRTSGLYVLPAGRYRWDRLAMGWWRFSFRGNEEAVFEVKEGKITYAGDFVYRDFGRFHIANRGLRALDWLEDEHPVMLERHGFEYSGHYPDLFPDFYRAERSAHPAPESRDKTRMAPAPTALPIPVATLWKPWRLRSMALSPDGHRIAAVVADEVDKDTARATEKAREGRRHASELLADDPNTRWRIELTDLRRGEVATVVESEFPIADLRWAGEDILLAHLTLSPFAPPGLSALHFKPDGSHEWTVSPRVGQVVELLPAEPGFALFATRAQGRGELDIYKLDVRSSDAIRNYRFDRKNRLNAGLADDFAWFTDAGGRIRAALVQRQGQQVLVHGGEGRFRDVRVIEDRDEFWPLMVSADGLEILGTSSAGRGQRDLVALDPATNTITRTVFSKPGFDMEALRVDPAQQPVGASYYEAGQWVSEYFDAGSQRVTETLARSFPNRTVASVGRSRDGRRWLLWVDGSDQPPQLYHLDLDAGRAMLVDEAAPWLKADQLAPSQVLKLTARDGLALEAFLTLPRQPGRRPLVVMPHGGPIGVADRRHFDAEVQFLASLGYAVLQVNFRGSGGYGTAFREAGHRNYGTGIEDDIDAAIEHALAGFPLDRERICMVGASYGGYSGLISAVRWPDRFRCVVSLSGVSDRALFFTASDSGRRAEVREQLEKLIGHPGKEPDLMRETSPLFRYQDLKTPVMLVHGGEDLRVDYEHTRRLVRMLNLAGRPPVLVELRGQGHGIEGEDDIVRTWEGIAGFLQQHLGASPAPAPVASTP